MNPALHTHHRLSMPTAWRVARRRGGVGFDGATRATRIRAARCAADALG